jgi:hypothetical protein
MRDFLALGRCYSGQQADPEMAQIVMGFFRDSHRFEGFLETDPAVPPAVRQSVRGHVAESPFIILAASMAEPPYVRQPTIRTVIDESPPRTTLRIEWHNPDGSIGSEDAFDIAAGAVREWRTFMSRHRLNG